MNTFDANSPTEGPMFRQVRWRMTVFTVILVTSLYAVSAFAFYGIVHRVVMNTIDNRLLLDVRGGAIKRALRGGKPLPNAYFFVQLNGQTYQDMPSFLLSKVSNMVENHPPLVRKQRDFTYQNTPYRIMVAPVHVSMRGTTYLGYWVAARDVSQQYEVLYRVKQVLMYVGTGGLLVAAVIGYFLAARSLLPIRAAWRRQAEFAADASHELRTPLAVIQSNLNLVLEHPDETVLENFEWLNAAQSELRRLSRMVNDLLTLERAGADAIPFKLERIDVSDVVARAVELFDGVAEQKQLALRLDTDGELTVVGDAERLHQLAVILLDNAIKYTPSGGRVSVRVWRARQMVCIEVQDTGCGIAKDDLPRIFQRFYRSNQARNQASEGFGLGLPIAHWIVTQHHGKLTVESEQGQGTTVTAWLPVRR